MSVYLIPIQVAMIVFPLIAFCLTLPYTIYQYHKYGSIPILRTLIIFSFIYYLINAYFMTMLPLPSIESVAKMTSPTMELRPFHSVYEIIRTTPFIYNDPSTYLPTLKESNMMVTLFNILLTLPFGIYLRYYFQCSLKKTIFLSFLLSLSFELIQLSALFGIYPRPYRLFEVDDLITNTLGGTLGYAMTPLFARFLPTREKLDAIAYEKGQKVSKPRKFFAFMIDAIFIAFIMIIFHFFQISFHISYFIIITVFYIILPFFKHGQTPGKLLTRIALENTEGTKKYQYLIHYIPLYLFILPTPYYFYQLLLLTKQINPILCYSGIIILLIIFFLTLCQFILSFFSSTKMWFDYFSHLTHISLIQQKD
ncbi:VanZ family protein [Candidatus Stoquefichus massiliensis]|uniref:VanZ family protein n=1 Tax=Candidatus Stoquefichus massiliensis TaxID=1470350 RepID=UPI0004845243|nr:VanZ family protein [Candidatus Stoquefichus massiliensis]